MIDPKFLEEFIRTLQDIEDDPEKVRRCKDYSVYSGSEQNREIEGLLWRYFDKAYAFGMVVTNYGDILKEHSLNDQDVIACTEDFVEKLDEEETLATIAYHFRWDHFCEGVLISKCVAEGKLLRLLKHLQSVQSNKA